MVIDFIFRSVELKNLFTDLINEETGLKNKETDRKKGTVHKYGEKIRHFFS